MRPFFQLPVCARCHDLSHRLSQFLLFARSNYGVLMRMWWRFKMMRTSPHSIFFFKYIFTCPAAEPAYAHTCAHTIFFYLFINVLYFILSNQSGALDEAFLKVVGRTGVKP